MSKENYGMGWLRDYPDFRDYDIHFDNAKKLSSRLKERDQRTVKKNLEILGVLEDLKVIPATHWDLRGECPSIEDQGALGSCTANACVGLVEYFELRAFHTYTNASRLFLYKATRNLMGLTGDTGASMKATMGALVLFGTPPEKYWPYSIADFDIEPGGFFYAFAQNYQAIAYYRLDSPGMNQASLLNRIKMNLLAHLPSMFGFTVYPSYHQADTTGKFPFPTEREAPIGGHALVAVGFDDGMEIINSANGEKTKGALLIRNSWGANWGENGYGWLPYDYVLKGLAVDWWSLIKNEWVDTKNFGVAQ